MSNPVIALFMLGLFIVFIFLGFPIAFTLMAMGIMFGAYAYWTPGQSIFENNIFYLFTQNTFSVMNNDVLISIPLFLFMGYIIERANILDKLFLSLQVSLRRVPGSMAVAALITCALFATATGIVGAVVTLMGLLALPAMLKAGYDEKLATGVIAAGGTLGILIPPSIMLIVYAATAGVSVVKLYAAAMVPGLRPGWTGAVWEPACADIDVAALHAHYLALMRQRGGELVTRARVTRLEHDGRSWQIETGRGETFRAGIVVNAAGAWADEVAELAGARPLGIQPYRRTVTQLRTDPAPRSDLPLVLDIGGSFYFKPESGRVWLSPHDEDPSPPCDAAPEELAVAHAIDRFQQVVDWDVAAVEHKWAGLRSFAPDRRPVYGFDPAIAGLFWFAGQGGYGIQTSPAAARLASQLLLGHERDAMTRTLDDALYDPARYKI